jgi:glycosyltransferase involved in cell wall biosynthesis
MAVLNGERYVQEAIGSVLAQSVGDFEFLIVDDASTDRTPEILAAQARGDSRIRVLRNESTLGPYPSLNRALTAARGSVIARHDADDVSPPDRFAIQIAALDSGPDVSLVTGWVDCFGEQGGGRRFLPPSWQPRLEWELMFNNVIGAGGHVMFPRALHGEPVLYSTKRTYAEDYELWCRLAGLGRIVCPARVIYRYRQHALSISARKKAEQDECVAAIRREYRSRYLRPDEHPETTEELWGFWISGSRPPAVSLRASYAHLLGIRSNFLAYVERRYGLQDRTRLEAELNRATADLLGYRLYRSARMLETRTCLDLLAITDTRREAAQVCGKAIGQAARSFRRKFRSALSRPFLRLFETLRARDLRRPQELME